MRSPKCARVAITSNTLAAGGAEKQRVILSNELARLGYTVSLVLIQGAGPLLDLVSADVEIVDLSENSPVGRYDWLITGTTNTEIALGVQLRARRRVSRWSIAVHNPVALGAPLLKRVAMLGCLVSDDLIALTPMHSHALEVRWGLRASHVISNGIEFRTAPAAVPRFEIGFIGRLSIEHKGLDRFVSAVAHPVLRNRTVAIAGTGPDENRLRASLEAAGRSDAKLLGHQDSSEFIARCDVLLVLSRWEAQPLVLLEARAAGTPVIASHEVAETSVPYVYAVDATSAESVASAVSTLVGQPRVEPDKGIADSVARMVQHYESILDAPPQSRRRRINLRPFLRSLRGRRTK